jgi:hypothetical protein
MIQNFATLLTQAQVERVHQVSLEIWRKPACWCATSTPARSSPSTAPW